jgi:putrescine transport system permease protein
MTREPRLFRAAALLFGFAFLYAPIVLLVVYSFNASRLVTVWGGFSTRWYAALAHDEQLTAAAGVSLRVAAASASLATALGTCAAIALARFGRFRGRGLFAAMTMAPLVLPEVIAGLSLLLLFVALDVPRGYWTIVVAHATMETCYVAVVVRERLDALDRSVEEAAMDLGASPAQCLWRVTLPLALPSIVAGYMLAFTLSLDDVVIASFVSGPGSTTLPMRVYSAARLGVSPEINAVSTVMLAVVGVCLCVHAAARRFAAAG